MVALAGGGWIDGIRLGGASDELSADLGAKTSLVELLLLVEETLLLIPGLLLVEAFPLPLVEAAGEGARSAAHGADGYAGGEETVEDSRSFSKESGGQHG